MTNDAIKEAMCADAEVNPRFRVCLRAAYGLPDDLQVWAEQESAIEPLPSAGALQATPEEVALMTAWFHQNDTHWASTFFDERLEKSPRRRCRCCERF